MALPGTSTARDVPLLVTSTSSSSERRISPSWSIAQLKTKLEPITGVPPSLQQLTLRLPGHQDVARLEAEDEELIRLDHWPLRPYAELQHCQGKVFSPRLYKCWTMHCSDVADLVKQSKQSDELWQVTSSDPSRVIAFATDDVSVPKQEMPMSTYDSLPDTVRDYKKKHGIGRFDPKAPEKQEQKVKSMWSQAETQGVTVDARCRLVNESTRRGKIAFVGPIPSLPGLPEAPWVGVVLDEPFGKNDGSVNGERVFTCAPKHGLFVRPDRIEVGDFPELGLEDDPDLEEI